MAYLYQCDVYRDILLMSSKLRELKGNVLNEQPSPAQNVKFKLKKIVNTQTVILCNFLGYTIAKFGTVKFQINKICMTETKGVI